MKKVGQEIVIASFVAFLVAWLVIIFAEKMTNGTLANWLNFGASIFGAAVSGVFSVISAIWAVNYQLKKQAAKEISEKILKNLDQMENLYKTLREPYDLAIDSDSSGWEMIKSETIMIDLWERPRFFIDEVSSLLNRTNSKVFLEVPKLIQEISRRHEELYLYIGKKRSITLGELQEKINKIIQVINDAKDLK